MIVEQFDSEGKATYSVKLIDAYPIMVAPLQLDWAQQNAFHNFQVTMAYRYWREEPVSINPFGNYMRVNNLYPNFDVSGALETTGAALFSRVDGQFLSKVQQGIRFGLNVGKAAKSSLSGRQQAGAPGDNTMINP